MPSIYRTGRTRLDLVRSALDGGQAGTNLALEGLVSPLAGLEALWTAPDRLGRPDGPAPTSACSAAYGGCRVPKQGN